MPKKKKTGLIGVIGCGNMGAAIIKQNSPLIVFDKDKAKTKALKRRYRIKESLNIRDLAENAKVIIIAVKPQDIKEVLDSLRRIINNKHLLISIAAGITTGYIESKIGRRVRVIRVMPNIAALVKSGISALAKGRFAGRNDLLTARKIFIKLGKTVILKEDKIDAFTAVAASSPAYVFYFMEALSGAARELGFDKKQADNLVMAAFDGSLRLLEKSRLGPGRLRRRVTSKGGTTEAALEVLRGENFSQTVKKAALAAAVKAKKIGAAAIYD